LGEAKQLELGCGLLYEPGEGVCEGYLSKPVSRIEEAGGLGFGKLEGKLLLACF